MAEWLKVLVLNQRAMKLTMLNPISSESFISIFFLFERECSSIGRTHALQA